MIPSLNHRFVYKIFITLVFLSLGRAPLGFSQTSNPVVGHHHINIDSLFTQAQIAIMDHHDLITAKKLFLQVIDSQPRNAEAHSKLAQIYILENDNYSAENEVKLALKYDPINPQYSFFYAAFLSDQGRYEEAAAIYERLIKDAEDPGPYLFGEALIFDKLRDYRHALNKANQISPKSKVSSELLLGSKVKWYDALHKRDSAIAIADQLRRSYPKNPKYYVWEIRDLVNQKDTNKVILILDTFLNQHFDDIDLYKSGFQTYAQCHDTGRLNKLSNQILHSDQFSPVQKVKIYIFLFLNIKDHPIFSSILDSDLPKLAYGPPKNIRAYLLNESWKKYQKDSTAAAELSRKVISVFPDNILAYYNYLNYLKEQNQTDSINKYSKIVINKFPNHRYSYYLQSMRATDSGRFPEAIQYLETAQKLSMQEDSLIPDFYIYKQLGAMYQEINQLDSSEVNFEKAYQINNHDPYLLNNYSYLLADLNKDLDKALEMSAKTVASYPDSSYYLDTYGWILYKQKDYLNARFYTQKAISNLKDLKDKSNAVIFEHLGDIEDALKDEEEAKTDWQKALKLDPDNPQLLKKLGQ